MTKTTPVTKAPVSVERLLAPHQRRSTGGPSPDQPRPVTHHADLAERERQEDAEDVELDQPRDVGVEGDDEGAETSESSRIPFEKTSRSPRCES